MKSIVVHLHEVVVQSLSDLKSTHARKSQSRLGPTHSTRPSRHRSLRQNALLYPRLLLERRGRHQIGILSMEKTMMHTIERLNRAWFPSCET